MMPLPPGDRIGGILGALDLDRFSGWLAVQIEGDHAAAIGSVEKIDLVSAGLGDIDGEIEPFARLGPTNVKEFVGRRNLVVGAVVRLVSIFRVRDADRLVMTELVVIIAIEWIQPAAAGILLAVVMVRDTFTAPILIGAHHRSRDSLRGVIG